ncbi:MAG: ABC transporter substrate-binding protein [Synergistaceae bacterium]|jgi:peptide/nickel transport system substrate-binding protein|nr:ABC transporter substrate-binding protein [Synergistaceae bacterium]
MKKVRMALLVTLVLMVFAFPAPGAEERTLNLSTLAPLTTIDPHATSNIQDIIFHRQIFEPLFFQNEATGKYEPRVAESYSISDDNLTYTFNIRKGIKFHNGEALKADDVVFSLNRALKSSKVRSYLASVAEVKALDDYTVTIRLGQPNAAFLNSQNMIMILSRKEVEEQGDEFGTKLTLAGTGPFYLTSLQHDVEWTCAAFADYYRGAAAIKKLHYVPITEASAGLIAFESGELDWYIAPIANWDALTNNPKYRTELVTANHISYVAVNYEHPPLNDDNIRLAIAYAIDKDAMNIACYDGNAVNADFMAPPENTGAPTKGVVYNYDPEKAREYVKKSAFPNGTKIGIINCSAGGYFEKMAQVLQSNLADIGLICDINRLDSATNLEMARNQKYDLLCTGLSPYGDYESLRMYSYTKMKGAYMVKYEGEKFDYKTMDDLWDAGIATTDLGERETIYSRLSDWIAGTATLLPIFHKVQPYAWTPNLVVPVNYPNYPQVYEWSWAKK